MAEALPYCECAHFAPMAIPLFATRMCAMCLRPYLSDLSHPKSKIGTP
jgi:hypothetical protein